MGSACCATAVNAEQESDRARIPVDNKSASFHL